MTACFDIKNKSINSIALSIEYNIDVIIMLFSGKTLFYKFCLLIKVYLKYKNQKSKKDRKVFYLESI